MKQRISIHKPGDYYFVSENEITSKGGMHLPLPATFGFAFLLKYYRLLSGLNQSAMAKSVGIDQPHLARLENLPVDKLPEIETIRKFIKTLGPEFKKNLEQCFPNTKF